MKLSLFGISIFIVLSLGACKDCEEPVDLGVSLTHIEYSPESYSVEVFPEFPVLEIPSDNELTYDGIRLGQHLFFDPILSADSTMSCSSCHFPDKAFTDNLGVSTGIDGIAGTRSSMSLVNQAFYNTGLFWDGRVGSLEEQALLPVEDPIELHNNWTELIDKLQEHELYQELFRKAFGIEHSGEMTKELAAKSLAQYQRIILSGNSLFDQTLRGTSSLSDEALEGFNMFFDFPDTKDAECGHCHQSPLMTDNTFKNNGITGVEDLDDYVDKGFGALTGNPLDNGKFRVPSLRNIELTAPYMHDGRFETLEEVIDHYISGGHPSPNKDPQIIPLTLNEVEKANLKAFLLTLTDTSYLDNELITNPFN